MIASLQSHPESFARKALLDAYNMRNQQVICRPTRIQPVLPVISRRSSTESQSRQRAAQAEINCNASSS
jgi:hypothetical protein